MIKMEEELKEFTVRIGPKLRKVLDDQKERIKEVTMDSITASDYEAGEIIAKKVIEHNLV